MARRHELQVLLESMLGSRDVYFQPPAGHKLTYPCIVYELDGMDLREANNLPYHVTNRYQVTYIDRNPDAAIVEQLAHLPQISFAQRFVVDNLHHTVFRLYY